VRKKGDEGARGTGRPSALTSRSSPQALPSSRYIFFGGKGGTGKTTAACGFALYLLDHSPEGESILLFSTDPAHSLSDSLCVEIGDRTVEVARRGTARLMAREMEAGRALEEFKTRHRATLSIIAERGTLLDESDIDALLDLSLPGMDGWEATRRLKAEDSTKHIPIVALTGHALAGHAEGARQAGCDAFVTKPCLPDALVAEIKRLLEPTARGSDEAGRPARTSKKRS
jgi:CheY-like chemotaxis protein